jgi:putative mycofactocin binding protein MftB
MMQTETVYSLTDGVQVRKEKFGLLFYNYRGPRLYFVPTEDLLDPDFFTSCRKVGELVDSIEAAKAWPRSWIESWVDQVMNMLRQKGLIYGQSIC